MPLVICCRLKFFRFRLWGGSPVVPKLMARSDLLRIETVGRSGSQAWDFPDDLSM